MTARFRRSRCPCVCTALWTSCRRGSTQARAPLARNSQVGRYSGEDLGDLDHIEMYIYHVGNETKRGYRFPTPELAIACPPPPPFFFSLSASLSPLSSTYLISHRFTLLPPSFNKIVPFRLFAPYLCPFLSFPAHRITMTPFSSHPLPSTSVH